MDRSRLVIAAAVALCVAGGLAIDSQPSRAEVGTPTPPVNAEAGIKSITAEYAKAFNANDAKAAALLWTEQGQYTGAEGETLDGRAAIEASLVKFFKAHPKVSTEVKVISVKPLGRGLAQVEGMVTTKFPGEKDLLASRYSALHTLQDGKWLASSVTEWVPDAATDVTAANLEWLVGDWTAKGDAGAVVNIGYAWDENKNFILGKYRVAKGKDVLSTGTEVIGTNPAGGLRSWMFDSSGTTSDGYWVREGNRWVSETYGVLPDGTEVTARNVFIPLGPDAFTWQTVERAINGEAVDALPPVKVTRVKQ